MRRHDFLPRTLVAAQLRPSFSTHLGATGNHQQDPGEHGLSRGSEAGGGQQGHHLLHPLPCQQQPRVGCGGLDPPTVTASTSSRPGLAPRKPPRKHAARAGLDAPRTSPTRDGGNPRSPPTRAGSAHAPRGTRTPHAARPSRRGRPAPTLPTQGVGGAWDPT